MGPKYPWTDRLLTPQSNTRLFLAEQRQLTNLVYYQYTSRLPILSTTAMLSSSNAIIQQCIALSSNQSYFDTSKTITWIHREGKSFLSELRIAKMYANKPNGASIWFRNKVLNKSYLCTTADLASSSNGNLSPGRHCLPATVQLTASDSIHSWGRIRKVAVKIAKINKVGR